MTVLSLAYHKLVEWPKSFACNKTALLPGGVGESCDPLLMLSALGRFGSTGVELGQSRGEGEGVEIAEIAVIARHRRDRKGSATLCRIVGEIG